MLMTVSEELLGLADNDEMLWREKVITRKEQLVDMHRTSVVWVVWVVWVSLGSFDSLGLGEFG
jgi:hypothetical protein